MKKIIFILLIIICGLMVINNIKEDKELRVRIIPNSNDRKDLSNKEKVKSFTICYLEEIYDKDYKKYINNINDTIDSFRIGVNSIVNDNVSVSFVNHTLYNKTYNGNGIKNTNELTLLIEIGFGKGDNWWGSIYPEFLLINSEDVIEYRSLILDICNKSKEKKDD